MSARDPIRGRLNEMKWYPIKLTAHVRTYAFGERLIPEMLGKTGVPDGVVAETWEISDYQDTTGTVTNGELAGRTLHDITMSYPTELVGAGWSGPHFPLLAKFLDASHMLPVHLHADDETAKRVYSAPNGKSEAWHILWADENASILAGLKDDPSDAGTVRRLQGPGLRSRHAALPDPGRRHDLCAGRDHPLVRARYADL